MKHLTCIISLIATLIFGVAIDAYAQPRIKGNVYGGGENAKVVVTYSYEEYKALPGNSAVTKDAFDILPLSAIIKPLAASTEVKFNHGEVYGDIYGGGALADVEGNTTVEISQVSETMKGKFAGRVFGGGMGNTEGEVKYANVLGNTTVNIFGGEIIWDRKWDKDNKQFVEWSNTTHSQFFDDTNKKYEDTHNIYAGGNLACTVGTWSDANTLSNPATGTSSLTMTRGLLSGSLLNSDEWKQAYAEHENPHFYAFGGGYGIYTKAHKSDVNICMPMVSDESVTGGDEQLARPMHAPGDPGSAEFPLDIITDNYGVAWTTVLGILGGGYNGHVEMTNVLVGDATYAHRVYGGGLGSYDGWVEAGEPATESAAADAVGKVGTVGLLGKVVSEDPVAHVTIAGGHIFGDVFGGGAGVASRKRNGSTFTDFTEIARVKGNTLVETTSYETYLTSKGEKETLLDSHPNKNANTDPDEKKQQAYPLYQRAQIFGNVYGGGDVANVTGNTKVKLFGGDVFGYTFGAGLGRLTTEAADYTVIGNVTRNSKVVTADLVDWTDTSLPIDYDEPYKPTAWDDIYGGGRNGVTNGNAMVNINGGKVGNNIFGGGLGNVDGANITSADVKGNTTVTVTGGSYQWRQIADVNGNIKTFPKTIPTGYKGSLDGYDKPFDRNVIYDRSMHYQLFEPVKDFFNYLTSSYTRDHSIYGGGNIACKVGTYDSDDILDDEGNIIAPTSGGVATVDMQHGLFEDEDICWTDDEQWNLATLCRYFACENASNYQFGVFGGGYGANTKVGETFVNLRMGESEANQAKWTTYMGKIVTAFGNLDDSTKDDYYGGTVGPNALNRYLTARMARSINVPSHTVLTAAGGGFAGYVAGNTSVHQHKRSGTLRVFGGGIGLRPDSVVLKTLDSAGAAAMTYGQVGGNTTVDVEYGVVVKDVYGGGAGIESIEYSRDNYFDFTNMARVKGKTDVTVHTTAANDPTQTLVYGMVFGGGDVANVGDPAFEPGDETAAGLLSSVPRAKVTVTAGCVFGDVFAGGSGRTKAYCDDYEKLGAVYGNTQLVIDETGSNSTWLWKDAYGGGRNGLVYGNTLVDVEGGWLGSDVYGGGLGNLDTKYNPVSGVDEPQVTKATVKHNTNILVRGGQYCLSQSWDEVARNWHPMNKDKADNAYSSQYDPIHNKFLIGHNIYGGGNVACDVAHDTWVDINKGLLPKENRLGHKETANLFEEDEWENIYNKHASPYFSVFGGGYGENTSVDNSHVTVNMGTDDGLIEPSDGDITAKEKSEIFADRQTLMDVIGGGFQGGVTNTCYVDIDGYTFMRNAFGGAYYATVGNTDVRVTSVNMDNVYGGGMMGDVMTNVNVRIGTEAVSPVSADDARSWNTNLIINEDVYGANDVSGYVGAQSLENGEITITGESEGVKLKLYGGTIKGSVYGGGNGDYLYLIDDEVAMVTVEDDYVITDDHSSTIYRVPLRASDFPSLAAMSNQQKMVNVISYRPSTMKVDIDFKGNSENDRLKVNGNIFGGGNSATISDFDGEEDTYEASVKMNVGSHIQLGGVYLGSDGDALFDSKQGYMTYFPMINNLQLYEEIDWTTPENQNIPIKFLPTPKPKRPEIYKNNIDLYFMPVEMALMPEVTWGKARQNNSVNLAKKSTEPGYQTYERVPEDENGLIDAEIGTFCCGGNRGNMDTNTNFHINFPEGLTITDKIVGGCNNANFQRDIYNPLDGTTRTLDHTGGYLLGSHGVGTGRTPQIHLTLRNKFKITETETIEGITYYKPKGNVYGGCYDRGVVRGDILLEVYSNMLYSGRDGSGNICGLDSVMLRRTTDKGYTVASVYGAGFGPETWVRGDTEVRLGDETHSSNLRYNRDGTYNASQLASSCNYIFGGGRQGNVIGNTNVQVHNGRVAGCVVGASYAGTLYGSAQTMIGFPELYYRAKVSRSYDILRVDEDQTHADFLGDDLRPLIRKKVYYTKGDLVTATAYNGIRDRIVENKRIEHNNDATFNKAAAITEAETELAAYFDKEHGIPANNDWSNINIQIDKAVYGGGYALATGSGSYTVMKYTDENKFLDNDIINTYGFNGTDGWENSHTDETVDFTKYGGNTFVIVGDISENYDEVAETRTAGYTLVDSGDKNGTEHNRDHIKLSSSQLKEVHLAIGNDVFGLFKELSMKEVYPDKYGTDGWDLPEHKEEGKQPSGQYMKITTEAVYTAEDRANGSKYYEFTGEGGIYGDGRLSISEGFRICDVIGYGYNGSTPKSPSLMNCIQRFDVARFKDCCISLLGDKDYTSAEGSQANAVAYSIARVSEILMESAIQQDRDYVDLADPLLTESQLKHSRNYVGLSSAQFDLSAIKSNDPFTDDASAALYHNRKGKVITAGMVIDGTEEDLGGTKTFSEPLSYYNVKKWYLNQYEDGAQKSDYYDDVNAQVRNEKQFQMRNSATARNMFGIFSGYALNVHSTHYDLLKNPTNYYGPVVGVFEVDLIGTRAGEAGGYAYAQNIHTEDVEIDVKDADGNVTGKQNVHTFLETSGNFVFPATEVRKVVDNCTPIAYNSTGRDVAEAHYWYVTGFKYFYNTTITGYTYDGKTKFFESDNSITKRLVLNGTKARQTVYLKNFHWLPRHAEPAYYETVAEYNAAWGTSLTSDQFDALPEEKKARCDIEHYYLTTAYDQNNVDGATTDAEAWNEVLGADNRTNSPFYNLQLSLSEFGNYTESEAGVDYPYISKMPQDTWHMSDGPVAEQYKIYEDQSVGLTNETNRDNPVLGLQLVDCMDNNGKDADGVTYYSKHLEDPCVAKIVLTTPAQNSYGEPIWSNYLEVRKDVVDADERTGTDYTDDPYYAFDTNGDYYSVTLEKAKELVGINIPVFEVDKGKYVSASDKSYNSSTEYYVIDSEGNYNKVSVTEDYFNEHKSDLYYFIEGAHKENYIYDITLTILYIKGPSYEGHIDIKNCALPGEMIRVSHENLRVESDETSLPHNGSFWTFGPGKKVWNDELDHSKGYHWELIDPTGTLEREAFDISGQRIRYRYNNPETRNFYYPYNPNVNDPLDEFYKRSVADKHTGAVAPIMNSGVYHNFVNVEKPDYFIPAYYFMNGYVAQYSFTVNGIDEVFTTTINPEDTLLIHNYHRMAMAANTVPADGAQDIKVSHAMKEFRNVSGIDDPGLTPQQKEDMTAEWQSVHKRPRVYIQDVDDFMAFAQYLQRTADATPPQNIHIRDAVAAIDGGDAEHSIDAYPSVDLSYINRYGTNHGQDVEFILMNDIDLTGKSWTDIDFNGILHGNGHVITGLSNTQSLFSSLGDGAHIYNLGMPTGRITSGDAHTDNQKYHCCYTFDTGEKGGEAPNQYDIHTVYRMNGDAVTSYTADDWRTGRVAYDLNEFYLAERLDRGVDDVDTHDHAGYVEELYGDGEYRFSRWSNKENNSEYLRSNADPYYQWGAGLDQDLKDDPSIVSNHYYVYNAAQHVISHKVDEPRAYYAEHEAVMYAGAAEYNAANGTSLDGVAFDALGDAQIKTPAVPYGVEEFRPLIDEAKFNSTSELTTKKNDYIFFGQTVNNASYTNGLGTVGSNLPGVIDASSRTSGIAQYGGVTHNVDDQNNRVWRAYGFYRSKEDDAFHFNRAAWALHPKLTAIDFTGQHEDQHEWDDSYYDGSRPATQDDVDAGNATAVDEPIRLSGTIFYPKVMDMPDNLTSFDVMGNRNYNADGSTRPLAQYDNENYGRVTQNLLVYNNGEKTALGTDVFTSTDVTIDPYGNVTYSEEKDVRYHNLVFNSSAVDPAPKFNTDYFHLVDKQDFNAPIPFAVNTRAWYERYPQKYRNLVDKDDDGTADYKSSSAWEGICIPFTATKVTAEKNGEISHFYGDTEGGNHTLHHEYWLQGFKGITAGDETVATFARPAVSGYNVFTDGNQSGASYVYPANTYFTSLYNYNNYYDTRDDEGEDAMGNHDNAWYAEDHTFDDYVHLTAAVPYIVAFPGDDFYEFTMQSYYKTDEYGKVDYAQKATFEVNATSPETIAFAIPVTDDNAVTTTVDTHTHHGTYLHETAMGVNAAGTAFESGQSVLPFRTYMTTTSSPAKCIYIVEDGIEEVQPDKPVEDLVKDMKIRIVGTTLIVESNSDATLPVYTPNGNLVVTVAVKPGITKQPLYKRGVYIVANRKYVAW